MRKTFSILDGFLFLAATAGILLFILLYDGIFPESAISKHINRKDVIRQAAAFVREMGLETEGFERRLELQKDQNQIRFLQTTFGSSRANRLMQDSLPSLFWQVQWRAKKDAPSPHAPGGEAPFSAPFRQIDFKSDLNGNPLSFSVLKEPKPSDTVQPAVRDHRETSALALRFFGSDSPNWPDAPDSVLSRGPVKQTIWIRNKPVGGLKVTLKIETLNGRITSAEKAVWLPPGFQHTERRESLFEGIAFLLIYLSLFILGMVYFVKLLKSDALDLKSGILPAILALSAWAVVYWIQMSAWQGWETLIGFLITAIFIAGGAWILYVIGESVTRRRWAEKLIVVDACRERLLFPELGRSLLRGILLAGLCVGVLTLTSLAGINVFKGFIGFGDSSLVHWSCRIPSLYILGKSFLSALFITGVLCLFLQSLSWRMRSAVLNGALLALFWGFFGFPVSRLMVYPQVLLQNLLLGLLFIWFFRSHDFVAVLTGAFIFPLFFYGIGIVHQGSGDLFIHGIILLAVIPATAVIALLALRSTPLGEKLGHYVPDYVRRVNERERLQRELEIARNVQLHFLPRGTPSIRGMEIATLCTPAKEVGGDYYDFIRYSPTKLGVVIGDVSGKGIPAAFYMTMTKGMLKSLTLSCDSPKDVLTHLNALFYENAERGVFISMTYSVFDMKTRKLVTARAGHNPMILRRSALGSTEEISSSGIALGLDRGELFRSNISERTLDLESNDLFLFYTDGINESLNDFQKEFGESRLLRFLDENADEKPGVLLGKLERELRRFAGDAPQHDDMTAVLIRIA
ncbi:PP2C family protein-serine/threonine phosphatase [bacterium]|nr:PP2C family protein-serine/threonine phosphatase [bacterium]